MGVDGSVGSTDDHACGLHRTWVYSLISNELKPSALSKMSKGGRVEVQRGEGRGGERIGDKVSLFVDDMIVYKSNPKILPQNSYT